MNNIGKQFVLDHQLTGPLGLFVALIGEAGPEAVIPLSKMGGAGGGTQITINVTGNTVMSDRDADKLGRRVELRYRDMDDTWVEVHYAGKLLCTALSTVILAADQDQAEKIIFTRATDRRKAHSLLAEAKRRVFGTVGIDMIAGPSEILVICDGHTDPDWIAMDLFSQAEHDELAQAILLCPDAAYLDAVQAAIKVRSEAQFLLDFRALGTTVLAERHGVTRQAIRKRWQKIQNGKTPVVAQVCGVG